MDRLSDALFGAREFLLKFFLAWVIGAVRATLSVVFVFCLIWIIFTATSLIVAFVEGTPMTPDRVDTTITALLDLVMLSPAGGAVIGLMRIFRTVAWLEGRRNKP